MKKEKKRHTIFGIYFSFSRQFFRENGDKSNFDHFLKINLNLNEEMSFHAREKTVLESLLEN